MLWFFSSSWASSSSTFTPFSIFSRSSSALRRSACLSFSSNSTRVASRFLLPVPRVRSRRSICDSFLASSALCSAICVALAVLAEATAAADWTASSSSFDASAFDFAAAAAAADSASARCSLNSFITSSNRSSNIPTSFVRSSNSTVTFATSLPLTAKSSSSCAIRISSSFIVSSNWDRNSLASISFSSSMVCANSICSRCTSTSLFNVLICAFFSAMVSA
mmetsp:Transcript_10246/g.18408  ORF Transcript_10246/g.18408 Transcript_10246/m.18408 type:complete len:221 (-) Transcript_10246:868-1530(-)